MPGMCLRIIARVIKDLVWMYKEYAIADVEEIPSQSTHLMTRESEAKRQGCQMHKIV
uniref:Uncharacterized protein n=1 Tax=Promethearchaeum syntrophicum TaxID=2594042 RepID=A0A5B9DF53_9ARCH|nr:hypothetical protein [Candidatus Prometheoarchaeum syntrophicum]QEE17764.1 hypothetical protein DSAG12_03602 [Candidatus Prometheoarchaeum syntrophicum]